jgi:undecaprenyl-diphosphatase
MRFLRDRFSPEAPFGLHFTLRALALVIACFWFCQLAAGISGGLGFSIADREAANWFYRQITPARTSLAEAVSFFGSSSLIGASVLTGTLVLFVRRDWYRLLALELALPGGGLLNLLLKDEFHRPRPRFEPPLIMAKDYSFPSGHTMLAVLFYGLLCVFVMSELRDCRWRLLAALIAILLATVIGATRIYLGVHYLSDVLGAMAAGVAWLIICLGGAGSLRRSRSGQLGSSG